MLEYHDDLSISNSAELWRRIHPTQVVKDGSGGYRPSSAAFENDSDDDPMSIFFASVVGETGRIPADVLQGLTNYALAAFTAGIAREFEQKVVRDPIEGEPAHGLVVGYKPHSIRKQWAKRCQWVVSPK